ncbi:hypothetical protein WBP07_01475 [Novosphingobium sp. BL-8A]|uniref:hypothetical protein n=1 Tax=Novosphingobium sp. BL-8A TaxID=3127639 RepID=UPI0037580B2E
MGQEFNLVRATFASASPALAAFDYLIAHSGAAGFLFVPRTNAVRSVELQWPDRKLNPFSAQAHTDHVNFYLRRPILNINPNLFDAAVAAFGPVKPNSLNEYRRHLRTVADVNEMLGFLRKQGAWPDHRHDRRFLAETFQPLTVRAPHVDGADC